MVTISPEFSRLHRSIARERPGLRGLPPKRPGVFFAVRCKQITVTGEEVPGLVM